MEHRPYDVILFGASGFTGRWILEELLATITSNQRVAVAGRSPERIRNVCDAHSATLRAAIGEYCSRTGCGAWLPVLECSADAPDTLLRAFRQGTTVISAVGPFNALGLPVVDAAIRAGANCVDISGEPLYIESVLTKLGDAAKAAGVTVVPACGFDCIPTDTSLLRIKRAYPTVTAISGYAYSDNVTTANTGTLFTAIESFKADNLARLRELRRGRKRNTSGAAGRPRAAARPWPVQRAPASVGKRWAVLFPGADHAVQQMSQDARGDEARVDVSLFFGVDSLLVVVLLVWIGFVITLASKVAFIERAVRAYPTVATLGAFGPEPSREQLLKQTATWKFVATDGAALRVDAQFKMADPGYGGTSTLVTACALALCGKTRKAIPLGAHTPSVAFEHSDLLERIERRGATFTMKRA